MKYFKDQHSNTIIKVPDEEQWYQKEMALNPDYREISKDDYVKLTQEAKGIKKD